MKTIGLIGGMSWESTQVYYRELNVQLNQTLGGLHSAKIILVNVDFQPIEQLMSQGHWDAVNQIIEKHCLTLQQAGVDCIAIATNTMHKLVPQIAPNLDVPIIHIADSVAQVIKTCKINTIGLLGTAFTMQEDFYHARLGSHSINALTPNQDDQIEINRIIFNELCQGEFTPQSKQTYLQVIERLKQQGAEAVVLACTEIGLLINQNDCETQLIDATEAHIKDIVNFALSDRKSE